MTGTGVLPVYNNVFKIGTAGRNSTDEQMAIIADMESFSVSFDNGIEEWTPMETEGWARRLMTAKSITISLNGKRNIGDEGNDYVASKRFVNGQDANSIFEWDAPDGSVIKIPCVINANTAGGDSTGAEGLECEILSDGKPTYTPPAKG